jgi:hypothetical protein
MRILRHALALSIALAPVVVQARQATGTATGTIVGQVTDATGAPLPAVAVTLSSEALMGPRTASTTAGGRYRFAALPPGGYRLAFSLAGFAGRESDVRVTVGFTVTADVTLGIATQREQVTVTRSHGVLDRQSAALAETFDSRRLAHLPGSRSMGGVVAAAHAIQLTPLDFASPTGILSGAQSAYGRNNSPRHTVEGIIVTGLFGSGFALDYGAFEEAVVRTGSHGAEWPTPGIHTQFVTRSGSNQHRGTIHAEYENRSWQSFNVDADQVGMLAPSGGGLSARDANRRWHYHDVNADIGGFVIRDGLWWYASLRDQSASSRLVNFPVKPHETRLKNYGGKATYQAAPGHTLVAYGQRGVNHQPFRLDPFGPAGSDLSAETAINETEDSTADQRNVARVWKLEWNAVFRDALLLEARAGQYGTRQGWNARGAGPRFEDIETLVVSGGSRDWHFDGRRDQAFGTLSYFRDGRGGSHHVKAGGELVRWLARESWLSGYPGDVLHVLRTGRPTGVFLFDTPTRSESGVWSMSAYVSDSWKMGRRLTVNLGLRFDRYRVFLPAQEHGPTATRFAAVRNLIDWNTFGPRVNAVYDLTSDGKTLVKLAFARYHVAPNANVGFSANPNPPQWWSQYGWTDANGSGLWERGEEGPRRQQRGGTAVESLDPALRLPVLNEVAGWLERELPAGVGLRTGFVWRGGYRHFARQNVLQPFDAFTLPVRLDDPGPDGIEGTADDGPGIGAYDLSPQFETFTSANVVRNVARSDTEYLTWEVTATRRFLGRWSLTAGLAHTWNADQAQGYSGQAVRTNSYPLTPNDLINTASGGRHEFTMWTARAHGTYEAPWSIRVTPLLRHQSGQPFGRTFSTDRTQIRYATVTVLAEPVGTRRTDNITLVDLRVEKSFRLGQNRRLAPFVDVLNCFNANPDLSVIWSSGPSFLRPTSIMPPRVARIGATLGW